MDFQEIRITNLGNTCYMNSLNSILRLSRLLGTVKNDNFINYLNQSDELYKTWYNTQIHLWSNHPENLLFDLKNY